MAPYRWFLCGACLTLPTAPARADGVDARLPIRIEAGVRAPAIEFPRRPTLVWRARMLEPLARAPVAESRGGFVIAHATGLVTELDGRGRLRSSIRVGSPLALGPVLLTNQRRLVVTEDGEAVVLLPSSRIAARERLVFREVDASALAIATLDGGALIATGARFARLGPTAALTALGSTREPLRALFEWRGLGIMVERSGRVLALAHAGDPFELAQFERPVRGAALHGERLFAIVAERDVVELDLATGRKRAVWTDPPLAPRSLSVSPRGNLRVLAGGNVIGLDPSGHETFRVAVRPGASTDAPVELSVDARGATLVVSSFAELRLVSPSGAVADVPGTQCPDPLPPIVLGSGLVVVSCRSGLLFGVSDRAP